MDKILGDMKRLRIQGARNVAKAGLDYVAKSMQWCADKDGAQRQLLESINRVMNVRPTEPMLLNSLAKVAVAFSKDRSKTPLAMRRAIASACARQRTEIDVAARRVAIRGAMAVADGDVIITHCHSSTLMEALAEARRRKKRFSVIVTETQPLMQGVKTAKETRRLGVPVTYCEDAAMAYAMRTATKAMVGCDAILPDGSVVNKIGTYLLALAAKDFGRPFIVLGETLKMAEAVEIEQRPASEVVDPRSVRGAKIINPAFDVTPARLVTVIITEKGRMEPARQSM